MTSKTFYAHAAIVTGVVEEVIEGTFHSVQVQLLVGPRKGARVAFDDRLLSFGREAGNDLVVPDEHVSRRHGELRFSHGHWELTNHSENGTRVGRKRVKGKPHRLQDGDTIAVGDTPIFRVFFTEGSPVGATAQVPGGVAALAGSVGEEDDAGGALMRVDEEAASGEDRSQGREALGLGRGGGWRGLSGKAKLWIGIGGWWVGMLLVIAVAVTTCQETGEQKQPLPAEFSEQQIAAVIRQERQVQFPNELRSREVLADANRAFTLIEHSDKKLYESYAAYREALALSGKRTFGDINDLQYQKVRDKLIDTLTEDYRAAYGFLAGGSYDKAARSLDQIFAYYKDVHSDFYKHLEKLQAIAAPRAGRRR